MADDIEISLGLDDTSLVKDLRDAKKILETWAKEIDSGSGVIEARLNVNTAQATTQVQNAIDSIQRQINNPTTIAKSNVSDNNKQSNADATAAAKRIKLEQEQEVNIAAIRAREAVAAEKAQQKEYADKNKLIAENNAIMQKYENERTIRAQKRADDLAAIDAKRVQHEVENAQFLNKARNDFDTKTRNDELSSIKATMQARASADREMLNSLPRLRYALYDVASGFNAVSQNLLNFGKDVITTSMQYETAFTGVERVTDLNKTQTKALRDELKALALQIPMTFQDIAGVAQLGAQLGISESSLTSFTQTVTQFSAVANVSTSSAAESFGKIGNVLNLTEGDYNQFANAVAYAGSKSAATEAQILSVAGQISGVASVAGYSAEQVVGLATAMASLGIAPELARSAMTQIFSDVNRAVLAGGTELQNYATLLGMTTDEAANLAKTNMPEFFLKLAGSMQGMDSTQLRSTLDILGLDATRVEQVLSKMASGFGKVTEAQSYASQGFSDSSFLAKAFADKADDLASKIQFLQNAISNLADTVGQNLSPILGPLIDTIKNIVVGLDIWASSPIGGTILAIATTVAVLVGAIAGFIGVVLTAAAGSLALATAIAVTRGAMTGSFIASITEVIASITGITISSGVATAALTALRIALLLSGVGIAVAVIGGIAAAAAGAAASSTKAAAGTSQLSKSIADAKARAKGTVPVLEDFNSQLKDIGSGSGGGNAGGAAAKIRTLTDYANDLSNVFSRAFDIRFSAGTALDNISKSFSSIAKSTSDARDEISGLNADISQLTADQSLQEYFLTVANAYGDTLSAAKINANLAKIKSDLISKNKSLATAQDKSNKTLVGNSDAAIQNRSDIIGLVKQYEDYVKSLASSGMGQDELASKTAQLKSDFIAQATQLGYNSTELATYAAAFDDVSFAITNIPRNISIGVDIDPNPAITSLNEILAAAQSAAGGIGSSFDDAANKIAAALEAEKQARIEASLYEDDIKALGATFTKFAPLLPPRISAELSTWNGGNWGYPHAAGGYISGPGSSTSDSIPAMLSNGEYVIKAAAVSKYGTGFFNQLNQMQAPRYFSGGGAVSASSSPTSMIVELSPVDRQLLAQAGNVQLAIDGRVITGATNRGNLVSAQRGTN